MPNTIKIKVKKTHAAAVVPSYALAGDAGLDLVGVSVEYDKAAGFLEFDTGLAFEIPEGYVGLVFPRSSISKYCLRLANSVGVIDSGYRGSVKLRFKLESGSAKSYQVGDKIGQLVVIPYPKVEIVEADTLSGSDRSTSGFGSTGS